MSEVKGARGRGTQAKGGKVTRGGRGGRAGGAGSGADDSTADGRVEELETKVKQLQDELATERRQRNYFQIQGEKLSEFWEVTKRELEESRANIRMKDREMEDAEERHQVEVKVLQQQAKHLMIEHGSDAAKLRTSAEAQLKVQEDEFGAQEADLRASCRRLQGQLREAQRAHDEMVANLKSTHEQQLTRLRGEFEARCKELEERYDRRVAQVRDEMETRRQAEVREIEERKNSHINELMHRHERAFQEMKAYYNDIFMSNADLIKSLKEQMADMRQKDSEKDKEVSDVRGENKKLVEPLKTAQTQVQELSVRVADLEKDLASFKATKQRLKNAERQLASLTWENEVMVQRLDVVQRERDELYAKFLTAIRDVQQKSGFRTMRLEQRIAAFRDALESKDTQLKEVIRAANLDPVAAASAQRQVESVIDDKNGVIRELQYELAKVGKQHTDMLRTYEAKLEEHGIPRENLGFTAQQLSIPPSAAGVVISPPAPITQ